SVCVRISEPSVRQSSQLPSSSACFCLPLLNRPCAEETACRIKSLPNPSSTLSSYFSFPILILKLNPSSFVHSSVQYFRNISNFNLFIFSLYYTTNFHLLIHLFTN